MAEFEKVDRQQEIKKDDTHTDSTMSIIVNMVRYLKENREQFDKKQDQRSE